MAHRNDVAAAVAEFRKVQLMYRHFGAADTEPRSEFVTLLEEAAAGRDPQVPDTPNGWQLYCVTETSAAAARELAWAAKACVAAAQADPASARMVLAQW